MHKIRIVAALLLALPLLSFGGRYFIHPMPLPPANDQAGIALLHAIRDGGLRNAIALSHLVAGEFRGLVFSVRCCNCR